MNNTTQILPSVKGISWIDCRYLPRIAEPASVRRTLFERFAPIAFIGEPKLTIKRSHGGEYKATLSFVSTEELPLHRGGALAYAVTLVSGEVLLIGRRTLPRAVTDVTYSSGTADGDAAGYSYTVTFYTNRDLPRIEFC
ncbi:MAG: hypothetical protein ACI30W_03240 [Muribaculaceae bacterium]